jgi:hypothetical protein
MALGVTNPPPLAMALSIKQKRQNTNIILSHKINFVQVKIYQTMNSAKVGTPLFHHIQSSSENRTVQYSNGHFPYTIFVRFSNSKFGHLVFNYSKTGPVFRPQYIGKAN